MKLRFHSNSLRLRLSQSEVAQLASAGRVEERVEFGPGEELSYVLESGSAGPTASFRNAQIVVTVPSNEAVAWAESDQTGLEGSSGNLKILVEKDFQCLHSDAELNLDTFPNPLADKF